jgi:hypothetical protein
MRRFAAALVVSGAVAVAAPAASASAPPGSPGCFGDFVSFFAQNPEQNPIGPTPTLGAFVSATAQASVPYGQTQIPFFKSVAPFFGCN